MKNNPVIRLTSFLFLTVFLMTFSTQAIAASAETIPSAVPMEGAAEERTAEEGYAAYRQKNVEIESVDDARIPINIRKSGERIWQGDFTVDKTGTYRLRIVYRYDETIRTAANISLQLDGAYPFTQCGEQTLPIFYERKETSAADSVDKYGNQLRPKDQVSTKSHSMVLYDSEGYYDAFEFVLTEGIHSLIFKATQDVTIEEAVFFTMNGLSYEAYLAQNGQPQVLPEKEIGFIQAEEYSAKSNSAISVQSDKSGAAMMPSDPARIRYNAISGTGWKQMGDQIQWEFSVPADGYYTLGCRYKQSDVEGFFVSRRVEIDGELLFQELDACEFPYASSWTYRELGGDTPYAFYLTAGPHTLTMTNVAGKTGEIVLSLQQAIEQLNQAYRSILAITGSSPDSYRDYYLDKELPECIETFQKVKEELSNTAAAMEELTGQSGGRISIVTQLIYQLQNFLKDASRIPKQLSSFKSNIASVASLMMNLQEQPLYLDYIAVVPYGQSHQPSAGFAAECEFFFKAFFSSFVSDYSMVGSGEESSQQIRVWFSGGREQAELVMGMITDSFTPESNIGVKLELMQVSLSQAILAGTAPDVVMTIARGQPVNLAARGALMDLTEQEGIDELLADYPQTALVPYTYDGRIYGLPVTMDFHMLFYRTDIFRELGVDVPDTWQEMYDLLPILQRHHMEIGIPYTSLTSMSTPDGGIGAKDIFATLVLQSGQDLYDEEQRSIRLDDQGIVNVFREWTRLYEEYELSLSYDFYNRFRTGEMPIAIQSYGTYNLLATAAPEIRGAWAMAPIPGTERDEIIDRTEATSGTAAVIPKTTKERGELSWTFLRWWLKAETQAQYGKEIELLLGQASRYNPANLRAISMLPWKQEELASLQTQISFLQDLPEVVGGYYVTRGLDNAFRSVVLLGDNYRDALLKSNSSINNELEHKWKEVHSKQ